MLDYVYHCRQRLQNKLELSLSAYQYVARSSTQPAVMLQYEEVVTHFLVHRIVFRIYVLESDLQFAVRQTLANECRYEVCCPSIVDQRAHYLELVFFGHDMREYSNKLQQKGVEQPNDSAIEFGQVLASARNPIHPRDCHYCVSNGSEHTRVLFEHFQGLLTALVYNGVPHP